MRKLDTKESSISTMVTTLEHAHRTASLGSSLRQLVIKLGIVSDPNHIAKISARLLTRSGPSDTNHMGGDDCHASTFSSQCPARYVHVSHLDSR